MYGHPDHIRAHEVAVAAFHAAGDTERFPEAGPAWAPNKLYYVVMPRAAVERFAARIREALPDAPFANRSSDFGVSEERVTTRVDVAGYTSTKHRALLAHRTQLGPEMWFAKIPEGLWADFSGTEFFQGVSGPVTPPEDDLFAGV
jgi:mycothiol S-conjugate amidase